MRYTAVTKHWLYNDAMKIYCITAEHLESKINNLH